MSELSGAMSVLGNLPRYDEPVITYVHCTGGSRRYEWAGPVPIELQFARKDGREMSDKEKRGVAKFGAVGGVHKRRTFETPEEAVEAGAALGIEPGGSHGQ